MGESGTVMGEEFTRKLVLDAARSLQKFIAISPPPPCECGRCEEKAIALEAAQELSCLAGRPFDDELVLEQLDDWLDSRN